MIKRLATVVHDLLARGPRLPALAYMTLLSLVSRNLLPVSLARRVHNSIRGRTHGRRWPAMDFAPRRVRMGAGTEVALVPHLDGFDGEALFCRQFDYDVSLVRWLEDNVASTYDLVIEVGANVGIHTVFLDALFRRAAAAPVTGAAPGPRPRIVSFEPSQEAYTRLLANLAANDAQFVRAYQAAIGSAGGLRAFFEPTGHLTNGSFLRAFSEFFSDDVVESVVVVLAASELERWLAPARRALIKIDVEGFEPELLTALAPLIERFHPDLIVEVLPFALDALNKSPALAGYQRSLIATGGLEDAASFHASRDHFDWLLRWPAPQIAVRPVSAWAA